MEKTSQSRFVAAKVHVTGYIFNMFKTSVEEMEDSEETRLLHSVCRLYGLWQIEEQQGYFLKCERIRYFPPGKLGSELFTDGYFDAAQIDKVQESVDELCAEIRTVAGEPMLRWLMNTC